MESAKMANLKVVRETNKNWCFNCRIKKGFVPKDDGAHTARVKVCECCGERKNILGDIHWIQTTKLF